MKQRSASTLIGLSCALLLSLTSTLFAGVTGKVTGVITDAATKEPLIGASVSLVGTSMGAVTDEKGRYTISNVPVGTYTLRITTVGYAAVEVANVSVSADLASYHDQSMSSETTDLGKTITVRAENPIIVKDKTASISLVRKDALKSMPVRGFDQVVAIQNSVVRVRSFSNRNTRGDREQVNGSELNLRGGRPSEVAYLVDGFSTNDPLTGVTTTRIGNNAIEEVQIIAGGFPAEYGHVASGIVNTVTRSGGDKLEVNFDVQSDNYSKENSFGQNWYSMDVGGPIPGLEKSHFFAAIETRDHGDRNPSWITKNDLSTLGGSDFSGWRLPYNTESGYAITGKLDFGITPTMKLQLTGNGSRDEWRSYQHQYFFNQAHIPYFDDKTLGINAKLTHSPSAKTYYHVSVSLNNIERFRGDGVFRKDLNRYANQSTTQEIFSLFWDTNSIWDDYLKRNSSYVGFAGQINSEVNEYHTLRGGFEFQRHTLRYYQHLFPKALALDSTGQLDSDPNNSNLEDIDRYGYDVFGNESENLGNDNAKHPVNFAAYLQDRFEWQDLVVNAGLRIDFFDYKTRRLKSLTSPFNPDGKPADATTGILDDSDFEPSEKFTRISPRLGIAFPVTERTQVRVNYGKFYQRPDLQRLYVGTEYYEYKVGSGGYYFPLGNPNLEPEKTTAYEVGMTQVLSDIMHFDASLFYRDIIDQVQVYSQAANPRQYATYRNSDYGTVKGLEVKLVMRRNKGLALDLKYSLSYATGTGSYPASQRNAAWTGAEAPVQTAPLDYDQRHSIVGNFDILLNRANGVDISEKSFLNDFNANILWGLQSGLPYAPQQVYNEVTLGNVAPTPDGPRNSKYGPWLFYVDMKLQRKFVLGQVTITPYLQVRNLFDRENVSSVFESSGKASTTTFLESDEGKNTAEQFDLNGTTSYGRSFAQMYELKENDPSNWNNPRQILFGLSVGF